MLAARASRITDATSSRAAPKQQARLEPTLSPVQRINRWRVMTRKLIIVLDAFHYKNCVMAAIGDRPYKTIFRSLRQTQVANAAETKMVIHKILDGQIMGKELGYSKTQKLPAAGTRTEPTLCQHNPINIRQGANGRSKWFTCVDCTMRWERIPVPEQNEIPDPMDLMMFGRYATQQDGEESSSHSRAVQPSAFEVCSFLGTERTDAELEPEHPVRSDSSTEFQWRRLRGSPGVRIMDHPDKPPLGTHFDTLDRQRCHHALAR